MDFRLRPTCHLIPSLLFLVERIQSTLDVQILVAVPLSLREAEAVGIRVEE